MTVPAPASRTSFIIDPDPAELANLRARVAEWLVASRQHDDVVDRAVLVTSELAHLAIDRSLVGHPVVVELRRTHSILAIAVVCRLDDGCPVSELGDLASAPDRLELEVLEHVADRLSTEGGARRVTLACTIHLADASG